MAAGRLKPPRLAAIRFSPSDIVSSLAAASYSVAVQQNGSTNVLSVRDSDAGSQSYSQSATSLAYLTAGDWIALHHTGTAEFQFGYGKTEIAMALM